MADLAKFSVYRLCSECDGLLRTSFQFCPVSDLVLHPLNSASVQLSTGRYFGVLSNGVWYALRVSHASPDLSPCWKADR